MFRDSKYTKWYFEIIANPDLSGYVEKHHIIPVSLGGEKSKINIARVSGRQHAILHRLLVKMVVCQEHRKSMLYARWCMTRRISGRSRCSAREYHQAKAGLREARLGTKHTEAALEKMRGKTLSIEARAKLSKHHYDRLAKKSKEEIVALASKAGMARANKIKTDPAFAAKVSAAHTGRTFTMSEEAKKKISLSKIGKPRSEETKQKMRDAIARKQLLKRA